MRRTPLQAVRIRFVVIAILSALAIATALAATPATAAERHRPRHRPIRTITVGATDFAFDAPVTVSAGTVRIRVEQHGTEPHQAGLVHLKGDATGGDWLGALAQSFPAANRLGTFVAGPNTSPRNGATEVVTDLAPGRYLIVCLIPSPDGTPHIVKGMQRDLTVTGPPHQVALARTRTARLREYSFVLPAHVRAGETLTVRNVGKEAHEMVIVKLRPGKTIQDLVAWDHPAFQPEPFPQPYIDVGGATPMAPGQSVRVTLPKRAGRYVLACFIPNAKNESHFALGMIAPIRVR